MERKNKSVLKCFTRGKSPISGPNNSHLPSANTERQDPLALLSAVEAGEGTRPDQTRPAVYSRNLCSGGDKHTQKLYKEKGYSEWLEPKLL